MPDIEPGAFGLQQLAEPFGVMGSRLAVGQEREIADCPVEQLTSGVRSEPARKCDGPSI